jgi:hypothetical protein
MIADLNGSASVDPSRLFPSDGKTPFGDWVNAGALKAGDKVSTADSIENYGPRIAANDNAPLTVTEIIRDNRAARVYNFEVESREGEITHNYFVGDDAAWVHNAGKYPPKAQRIMDRILKRESELIADTCELPEFGPGPDKTTRQGHRRIIAKLWKFFYRALN